MERIKSILFSTRLMAILFLTFAVAMACGTFIESKYNTETARIMVYNAWWFEAIMVFFMINFLGNIKRYQLYKKEKWATLLLHIAFIFIIAGAFITRYISYEGAMNIREGEASSQIFSEKNYLTVNVDGLYKGQLKRRVFEKHLLLSPQTNNNFSINDNFADIPFEVSYKDYIMDAKDTIKQSPTGKFFLKMVESSSGAREEHYLKEGEVQEIHNVIFALNKPTPGAINITTDGKNTTFSAPFEGDYMRMADKLKGQVTKNVTAPLMFRSLYSMAETRFVFPDQPIRGVKEVVSSNNFKSKKATNVLVLKIKSGGQEKEVSLEGRKGEQGVPTTVKVGKLEFIFYFGCKVYQLPFSIKLNDFIAKKYPGTEKSYSSYESHVTVQDGTKPFNADIYMNHILDYKGYRFFQSSFDPDEKGTVLSVNHDYWGTLITYIGYFMLFFGMVAILFNKHSRFGDLKRKLSNVKAKKAQLLLLLMFFSIGALAQDHKKDPNLDKQIDSLLNKYKVSEAHADSFGRLVIQDAGGRMKPINTFSSELLRKVSHKDTYKGMNADQVFLSISMMSRVWNEVPFIYVNPSNDSIRRIIGIPADQKYARFSDFINKDGSYKLSPYLDEAYRTANPNQFEKDFVETDKKINLLFSAINGSILKIFPIPKDKNNKWVSYDELAHVKMKAEDSLFANKIYPIYLMSLQSACISKNYKESDFYLNGIKKFQKAFGKQVMPSDQKITSEVLYNKYDVFKKLFYLYMIAGILMIVFAIIKIFKESKLINFLVNATHIVIALLFLLHTTGLIARWYISGHAPWSNSYESIIYVAWATMLFGLISDVKSKLTVASSAFVTAIILMAAYMNWIDPEIANLQPVLNSYWLMIHVAIIVASYGPFALGMILGFVCLLLMFFTNEKNKAKMDLNIQELTYINEMALTIGLVMLTIGNFLGGQWANESWGRYWGWDPKETWALISIMVYAFVIHSRFVPAMRGRWIFNVMSMFAFVSILFTYYGVNFHLVGLHSYASGEAKSLNWIWESLGGIAFIAAVTYPKYRKYYKK